MKNDNIPKVLTIAGSDSSGGAGIQADLKTMTAHKCFGMSVITAITAQNTLGVRAVLPVEPDMVRRQLEAVFDDIRPDAVKIGMLANEAVIEAVADTLKNYEAKNVVLDPVFVSTSGCALIEDGAVDALCTRLVPLADVITPNVPEAERLASVKMRNSVTGIQCAGKTEDTFAGMKIETVEDMKSAALRIGEWYGGSILVKGGHLTDVAMAADWLWMNGIGYMYETEFIDNPNTHGTGCTLSSAIACNLAMGRDLRRSVADAKQYLTGAISVGLDIGKGRGPLNHMWRMS